VTDWLREGLRYIESGLRLAAIECLEKAREMDPENPGVLFHLGEAYLKEQRLGKARRCFAAIVSRQPQWNGGAASGALARVEAAVQGLEENFTACRVMLQHDKFCAEAFFNLGRLHLRLGEYEEAIVDFETARSCQWDAADVFFNLGEIRLELGEPEGALKCFEKAIEVDPEPDHFWFYKAYALRRLGRLREALAAVERALSIHPDGDDARWLRAAILAELQPE
jgi:tetratricopeptide (TPR) repeat protein